MSSPDLSRAMCLACQIDFPPAIQINRQPVCPECHGDAYWVVAVISIEGVRGGAGEGAAGARSTHSNGGPLTHGASFGGPGPLRHGVSVGGVFGA